LEKENLDKENKGSSPGGNSPRSLNSVVLSRDLEEVREKVERMVKKSQQHTADGAQGSEVKGGRESLVQCYL
jgi:hypothetical protein